MLLPHSSALFRRHDADPGGCSNTYPQSLALFIIIAVVRVTLLRVSTAHTRAGRLPTPGAGGGNGTDAGRWNGGIAGRRRLTFWVLLYPF